MTLSFPMAFTICIGIYYVASVINSFTKGRIGAMFSVSLFFLLGFWFFLPLDIIQTAKLDQVAEITNFVILIHVGTLFNLSSFKQDWKVVVTTLAGIAGITIIMLTLGRVLFGYEYSLISIPPLAGGTFATKIVMDAAVEAGIPEMASRALLIHSFQSFFCIPLIGIGVRRVSKLLLKNYDGKQVSFSLNAVKPEGKPSLLDKKLPRQFKNPTYHLFCCCLLGLLASEISSYTSQWTNGILGSALVSILLGFLACELGILERNPLDKAEVFNFLMMAMLINMRASLGDVALSEIATKLTPVFGALILAMIGVFALAIPVGRLLGFDGATVMTFAFCVFGAYPLNYQTAMDAIEGVTNDPQQIAYLKQSIIPKVLLGGIVSVTITSVLMAGVIAGLL